MTDLTEKWADCELEKGYYYIKDNRGDIHIDEYADEYSCGYYIKTRFSSDSVEEVLAQVPSYDELKDMKEYLDYSIKNRHQLTKQINYWQDETDKLKEENSRQKELIQRLGSDIEGLDIKKMVLIVEVNNLKGLLKECQEFILERLDGLCGGEKDELLTKIEEVLK